MIRAIAEPSQCRTARRRGDASVFVRGNCTDALSPSGVAVTTYEPIAAFAVHETAALPSRSVRTECVVLPEANVQEDPLAGATKSTRIPFSGVPAGDLTMAERFFAN